MSKKFILFFLLSFSLLGCTSPSSLENLEESNKKENYDNAIKTANKKVNKNIVDNFDKNNKKHVDKNTPINANKLQKNKPNKKSINVFEEEVSIEAPLKYQHPLQSTDKIYFMLGEDDYGKYLYAEGSIVKGAYKKFIRYVDGYKKNGIYLNRLMMHSNGGLLNEGLQIAKYIRDNGWITDADPYIKCYSSCGFVYASGVEYRISKGAEIGFHRPYYSDKPDTPEIIRQVYQDYKSYWSYINGDPVLYDNFMMNYGRDEMLILDSSTIKSHFAPVGVY
ncbi:hypothetical protein [Vibrio sp. PNB23_22_7]